MQPRIEETPIRQLTGAMLAGLLAVAAPSGCASQNVDRSPAPEPPPRRRRCPAAAGHHPAQALVGRWGLAAYHKPEDRARTEAAARGQCAPSLHYRPAVRAAA